MYKFAEPTSLKVQTPEIMDELNVIEREVKTWIDETFQARWGRLFQLSNETERRAICEAHARGVEQALEAQFGEDVLTQVVAIDEPDGWRVLVQLAKYEGYMPILIDSVYTEESGIHIDTDGDGQ